MARHCCWSRSPLACHDLKTPIRHITYFSSLMAEAKSDEGKVDEMSGQIKKCATAYVVKPIGFDENDAAIERLVKFWFETAVI